MGTKATKKERIELALEDIGDWASVNDIHARPELSDISKVSLVDYLRRMSEARSIRTLRPNGKHSSVFYKADNVLSLKSITMSSRPVYKSLYASRPPEIIPIRKRISEPRHVVGSNENY